MKKYNTSVFIGRFQPVTRGHERVFHEALTISEKLLIIVGSPNGPRSYLNPFTLQERREMIEACFTPEQRKNVEISSVGDFAYNDVAWIEAIQQRVTTFALANFNTTEKTTLVGHSKDNTSYYLKLFPNWDATEINNYMGLSATPLRETYFRSEKEETIDWLENGKLIDYALSPTTREFLLHFMQGSAYKDIVDEYNFIRGYKKKWGDGPFLTVDAIVVQSGNVLMIRRGQRPGKGLLAMPGGFMNPGERLDDAVLRELDEETKIDVPPAVLRGSLKAKEIFDNPHRDPRARIITQAYLFVLPSKTYLPKVKGSDDAAFASWIPLNDLKETDCFADHYHVVRRMIGYA